MARAAQTTPSTAASTALRALRDVGAAAWFGGSLMGASGLNAAADAAGGPQDRERVVAAGWARWTPIFRAAAAAHLLGSIGLLAQRRSKADLVGLGLTTAAVGAVAGTAVMGSKEVPETTIHAVEWTVPALLAGVILSGVGRKG
ncbi:hypothetical protein LWC35_04315 [Pseudonocardia kujensis]|uniref:hypothetical protein n=1 Tax=Pseudonocardia kujensis TaxID=1128675 RepID=UPI001E3A4BF1|nr:hypothetical protein [Pseudonocardia kujensis]MCE0762140.1 hypothetical protein [Pseudonocardia kujensis]